MKRTTDKNADKNNRLKIVFLQVGGMMLIGGALFSMATVIIPNSDIKMVLKIASAILSVLGAGCYFMGFFAPDNE